MEKSLRFEELRRFMIVEFRLDFSLQLSPEYLDASLNLVDQN